MMPFVMRTMTFLSAPPAPTTTSSSFLGVRAQNGSASRFVSAISGGVPVRVTEPLIEAVPDAGGADSGVRSFSAAAPCATTMGSARGSSFLQAPAANAAQTSTNPTRRVVMVSVANRRPEDRQAAPTSRAVDDAPDGLDEAIEPLGRRGEIAADPELAI